MLVQTQLAQLLVNDQASKIPKMDSLENSVATRSFNATLDKTET
jgi:hypothetical protein